ANPPQNPALSSVAARTSAPPTPEAATAEGALAAQPGQADLWQLKRRLQRRLVSELSPHQELASGAAIRRRIEKLFDEILDEEGVLLTQIKRGRLFEAITADILAFGPIQPLLHDDSVTEIMVNGAYQVYVERNGLLEETDVAF